MVQEVSFKSNNQRVLGVLDKSSFTTLTGSEATEQGIAKQEKRDEVRSQRGD